MAIFLAVLSVGSYIACFGVQSEILQAAAQGDGVRAGTVLRKHIVVQLGFAALFLVGLLIVRPFRGMSDELACLAALGIFIGSVFNNLSWRQYGEGNFLLSTALRGAAPLVTLVVSFGFFLFDSVSAEIVAVIYVSTQLVCMAPLLSFKKRHTERVNVRMIDIYRNSSAFFLCQAESLVLARTPVIASGIWLPPQLTAVISIALSLAELQASLPQMRSAISFKEASTTSRPRLTNRQLVSSIKALLPGTVIVILLSFVARIWLDEAYSALPLYVGLLSLGVALQAVAASAVNVLTARRSLSHVIGIQFGVLLVAALALFMFASGQVPVALGTWSIAVAVGCFVIIFLASQRAKGRHL
ncbi:hypothetical protein [Arthrobacter sp. ZGTC412]|uniref:hypothetical protein n=1 Tax=Arthrobacter sp. ZGTC412 TaxID=2058900 RepID=UPI0011B08291|nr:hypothetical protein [Arthrobacter sp. ZGTC412]